MLDPTAEPTGRERFTVSVAFTGKVLALGIPAAAADHWVRVYRSDAKLAELAIGERVNVTDSHEGTGVWVGRIADAAHDVDEDLENEEVGEGRS